MRVITGSARGRRLKELPGMETRPTTDRVKEGLFSAIQFDIEGRRVLDLFGGTGQLGIECLSRGAASAVFVEQRRAAVELIRENLALTGLGGRAQVIQADALAFLESAPGRFGVILLDPPYGQGLLEASLEKIVRIDILAPHGIMTAEHPAASPPPPVRGPYRIHRAYRYGKIGLTVLRRDGEQKSEEEDP